MRTFTQFAKQTPKIKDRNKAGGNPSGVRRPFPKTFIKSNGLISLIYEMLHKGSVLRVIPHGKLHDNKTKTELDTETDVFYSFVLYFFGLKKIKICAETRLPRVASSLL